MTDYLGRLALNSSATGTYRLQNFVLSTDTDGLKAELTVMCFSTSGDLLGAAIEQLSSELQAASRYVRYNAGTTNPVTYDIVSASDFKLVEKYTWQANWQSVTFTLRLAAPGIGADQLLYNLQAVNVPQGLGMSLESIVTTKEAELDVNVHDQSGNDMHSVWVFLTHKCMSGDANVALTAMPHWLVLASSLTWTTMSAGTHANCWGNTNRNTAASSWQTADLETNNYPQGRYKLLVRAAISAGTGYVMDSVNQSPVAITSTNYIIVEMGDIDLPVKDTAPGVASPLTFSVRGDGNTIYINGFILIPLDQGGLFAYHPTVQSVETHTVDCGPRGMYVNGVTNFGDIISANILRTSRGTYQCAQMLDAEEPSGSTWPTSWSHTAGITAVASQFRVTATGSNESASSINLSGLGAPVVPGEYYEVSWTRRMTARTLGTGFLSVSFLDTAGATVQSTEFDNITAVDGADVNKTIYVKAPPGAVYAQVGIGAYGTPTLTINFWNVVFKRCPSALVILCEDSAGTLSSNTHAVQTTIRSRPHVEIQR